jgi:hypothetical protein
LGISKIFQGKKGDAEIQ